MHTLVLYHHGLRTRSPYELFYFDEIHHKTNEQNEYKQIMVISPSGSANTLASLPKTGKHFTNEVEVTFNDSGGLLLPGLPDSSDDTRQTRIFLPGYIRNDRTVTLPKQLSADEALGCITELKDRAKQMFSQKVVSYKKKSRERVLYVAQGELAHVLPHQADIILSDRATTCHILILHSTSEHASPLASCTHIDGPHYDNSILEIFQEHERHHMRYTKRNQPTRPMEMKVHIIGGFNDSKGYSRKISNWLIDLLADISYKCHEGLRLTLETCAITSINNSEQGGPIARGLALDLRSGHAYLARCCADAIPVFMLRSARLWSRETGDSSRQHLHLIHHTQSNHVCISPFVFASFDSLDFLLSLPDELLRYYTSTSPDFEENDFAAHVRQTLIFLHKVSSQCFFGRFCDKPLLLSRLGHSNEWAVL